MKGTAIGYIRVSTDAQELGPVAQRDAIEKWCAAKGIPLAGVHEDIGVSGAAPLEKRPGLLAAMDAVRNHGGAVLVVHKRDRLARDIVVAASVERLVEREGGEICAVEGSVEGNTPEAKLLRSIVDCFAEFERALIRSRTRAALRVKRERGEYGGGLSPYGWRVGADGVHLEPAPEEQDAIRVAGEFRARGDSLRKIGRELELLGIMPKKALHWSAVTVRSLIAAEVA